MSVPVVYAGTGRIPILQEIRENIQKTLGSFSEETVPSLRGLHCPAAVHFGYHSHSSVEDMDRPCHLLISNVTRELEKVNSLSFETIQELLTSNFQVDSLQNEKDSSCDVIFIKKQRHENDHDSDEVEDEDEDNENDYDFDKLRKHETGPKLRSLLHKVIKDREVIAELKLNEETITNIVPIVDNHVRYLTNTSATENKAPVLDVTVLRYPDVHYQYFKLYRLRMHVKLLRELEDIKYLMGKHGLIIEFESQKFHPKDDFINQLTSDVHDKEHKKSLKFFGHQGEAINSA